MPLATTDSVTGFPDVVVVDAGCVVTAGLTQGMSCVIVTLLSATVSVPLRLEPELLAATVNAMPPFPLPVALDVIVIHGSFDVALHEQLPGVVTEIEPVPPLGSMVNAVGETEYVHGDTVTVACALSIVPHAFVTRAK